MKTMKLIVMCGTFCLTVLSSVQAKMVEHPENAYSVQASQDLVALAQKAATIVDFDTYYEIGMPTKAGIAINPLSNFVVYGINPLTKNPFIIANPEWLAKMPEEQQLFFFARNFLTFKEGKPLLMKVVPYLYILFSILLSIFLFFALGKTPLKNQRIWVRVLLVIALMMASELLITDRLEAAMLRYLGKRFDINILELVVQKTKDRDAAVKALEFYDSSIQDEAHNDEKFWAPYKNLFAEYAQELKKNS